MTPKDHILALINAQDIIRRAWVDFDHTILGKDLRDIDREMTKVINQLGTMYPIKYESSI